MSNYIKKAAAHARLLKLASAARLIRRQRALQKYAQAVQMQKQALGTGATAGIGAGLGGLIGGGIGYGLGKKDKKLLAALIGAGAGAGIGGLGGYGLGAYLNREVDPTGAPKYDPAFAKTPEGAMYIAESAANHVTPEEKAKNEKIRAKRDEIRAFNRAVRAWGASTGAGNAGDGSYDPTLVTMYLNEDGTRKAPEGYDFQTGGMLPGFDPLQ